MLANGDSEYLIITQERDIGNTWEHFNVLQSLVFSREQTLFIPVPTPNGLGERGSRSGISAD